MTLNERLELLIQNYFGQVVRWGCPYHRVRGNTFLCNKLINQSINCLAKFPKPVAHYWVLYISPGDASRWVIALVIMVVGEILLVMTHHILVDNVVGPSLALLAFLIWNKEFYVSIGAWIIDNSFFMNSMQPMRTAVKHLEAGFRHYVSSFYDSLNKDNKSANLAIDRTISRRRRRNSNASRNA